MGQWRGSAWEFNICVFLVSMHLVTSSLPEALFCPRFVLRTGEFLKLKGNQRKSPDLFCRYHTSLWYWVVHQFTCFGILQLGFTTQELPSLFCWYVYFDQNNWDNAAWLAMELALDKIYTMIKAFQKFEALQRSNDCKKIYPSTTVQSSMWTIQICEMMPWFRPLTSTTYKCIYVILWYSIPVTCLRQQL